MMDNAAKTIVRLLQQRLAQREKQLAHHGARQGGEWRSLMKTFIQPGTFPLLIITVLALTSCRKNNPSGGGGVVATDLLRPATMRFYEGPVGGGGPVWKYEYDKDNFLVKFGEEGKNFRNVDGGKVELKLFATNFETTTLYDYSIAGPGTMSIYEPKLSPATVSIQTAIRNLLNNQITKPPVIEWNFSYNSDFQVVKEVTAVDSDREVYYTYDDKKNLKKIEFMSLVDKHWMVGVRTTVTGYDDKRSPFSAVKGYRWASYPQNYNDQYAQAFCINNPTQMKTEFWSTTKNAYYLAEQTDFGYAYNAQGYPTRIDVKTTYTPEIGAASGAIRTYEFTYK
ncbi:hypothetical protein DU508_11325 [Pedobacter chinensis]|uniref:DUF4595 domain-containing protein n=2 Tax=Pedobacter chinensis TaxID=2282421 RepID=A0A369PYZ0_9SPHI|nr:hypothetical protein DU508_11325 [Pedobacter chinensis]